ncbi:DUF1490 family protein [Streptomyces sp. NPDC042207]|uniref:DUF1490 family protein n=1 Tax=Streptomyces sp. NPDC042207 TaxID=3154331 RepID=UPI0033DE8009
MQWPTSSAEEACAWASVRPDARYGRTRGSVTQQRRKESFTHPLTVAGAAAGRLAHYAVSGVVGGLIIRGVTKRTPDGQPAVRKALVGGITRGIVAGRWIASAAEEARLKAGDMIAEARTTLGEEAPPPSAVSIAGNDLRQVTAVVELSRHTLRVVRQNYGLAIGVDLLGLLASAGGSMNPVLAALLHNMSSIAVVGNSARLVNHTPHLPRVTDGELKAAPLEDRRVH